MKARPIANTRRHGDHRFINQTADHAGQCAFYTRHADNHVGVEEQIAAVEEAVDAGYTDIVGALYPGSEEFQGLGSFFGHGTVGGAAGDHSRVRRLGH